MSACTTCGKCPCYEHERKTVASRTHDQALRHLRSRLDGSVSAGRYEDVIDETLAYADQLHEQLEAERSARHGAETFSDELAEERNELRAKLQAAERLIEKARTWRRDVLDIEDRGLPRRSWEAELLDAVEEYDRAATRDDAGKENG